ncbi:MAG: galactokinase [Anaerolineales bacterium]
MSAPPELLQGFVQAYARPPQIVTRGPGRVNLLGEHVDYNDGQVLPVAIDRAAWVACTIADTPTVSIHALDLGEHVTFHLSELKHKADDRGQPLPTWARYPAGVAWALVERGYKVGGLQAALTSDIPIGAGLSSSAAVEVAFVIAWQAIGQWALPRLELAQACQQAENEYVGVQCGLMDQFASLHGLSCHALLFDCRTLDWKPLPLPSGTALVIANSGVRRALSSSAYNQRRRACRQAVEILAGHIPNVAALRDVTEDAFTQHASALPPKVRRRAEHVVKEIARVTQATHSLQDGDAPRLGALMLEGHASLRDLYQVSSPELDALVDIAASLPGCYGARLTGAGFGGCTINLVENSQAQDFTRRLAAEYQDRIGRQPAVWISRASDGAAVLAQ